MRVGDSYTSTHQRTRMHVHSAPRHVMGYILKIKTVFNNIPYLVHWDLRPFPAEVVLSHYDLLQ